MPHNKYVHIFRRRREGKTDYKKRRGIIIGKRPFLSVRVSGRYVYGQIIRPTATGDLTLCAASSRDLPKQFGWKGSTKSIPGAYLTGFHLGHIAKREGVGGAVVYSGVGRFVHGSRLSSVIAGARDAGLKVQIDDESLPDEARIKGEHISKFGKDLESKDKDAFNKAFSGLLASGLNPADYPSHFEQVKSSIAKSSSG